MPFAYEARAARLPASNQERISAMAMYTTALTRRSDAELALTIIEPSYQALKSGEKMPLKRQKVILAARAYPLLTLERYSEAEPNYRDVLRLDEQVFGVGDLRTSVAMNNLAICLSRQSRFTQARDVMQRVVAIYRAKGETDDPQVAFALVNLGSILRKADEPAAAFTALEEALGIFAHRPDVSYQQATKARFEMAWVQEALGQYEAALQSLELLSVIAVKEAERYVYARNPEPDLLDARLRTRLRRLPKDCALFALEQFPQLLPKQALEAKILQSQCALENLSPEAARTIFSPLTRDPAVLQALPPYVAALQADLQKAFRSTR